MEAWGLTPFWITWVGYRGKLPVACLSVFELHLHMWQGKIGKIMQLLFPPDASILRQKSMIVFKCVSHLEVLGQVFWNLKAQSDITGQYLQCCSVDWQPEPLAEGVFFHSERFFFFFSWAFPVRWDEVWEIAWRYLILVSGMNAVVINLENLLGIVFNSSLKVCCLFSSFDFVARAARAGPSTVQMLLAVLWPGLQLPLSTRLLTTLLFLWGCRMIAES